MNRERTLAGGIAIIVMVSLLAVVLIPGAIAETGIEDVRASSLQIEDVAIEPGSVSGGTTTLGVETRLEHRGGPAENVTVLVRAIHADSGLVETTTEREVPTIEGEREASVTQNVSIERRGDYRIETVVFRDGERIAEGAKESTASAPSNRPTQKRTSPSTGRTARVSSRQSSIRLPTPGTSGPRSTFQRT